MCNKDDLVSYLYDELDAASRLAFEGHLRGCADCRDELAAMRSVRADLLTWSPPQPDFAFRIVADVADNAGSNVLRPVVPSWRAWFTPAAGFAAAAVLVLAAAAGLARVEVHSGPDGFTVRTGASAPAAESPYAFAGLRPRDVNLANDAGVDPFVALERRINALETASHAGSGFRTASSVRSSDAELLRVVKDLLAQNEKQQKVEFAIRLQQLMRDIDLKRTADLNNMRVGIGKIDASVTEEAATHSALMNYILANSKQK